MTQTRIIQVVALLVALAGVIGASFLTRPIQDMRVEHRLQLAGNDVGDAPVIVTLANALGGPVRAVAVVFLWQRAEKLKEAGQYQEANQWAQWISSLMPGFSEVWIFQSWNNAYNISVATHTQTERWYWVRSGVELLRSQGLRYNPHDEELYRQLSWIFLHKIGGYTDDMNKYYKRQVALRWQVMLGTPPTRMDEDQARARAQALVDAPDTEAELRAAHPKIQQVLNVFDDVDMGETLAIRLDRIGLVMMALDSYSMELVKDRDAYLFNAVRRINSQLDPTVQGMSEARIKAVAQVARSEDAQVREAFDAYMDYLRKRVLQDEYNMDPALMFDLQFSNGQADDIAVGPVDWRHPGAHALYWGWLGAREAVAREDKTDVNMVNLYRGMIHAIQLLAHEGSISFDPLSGREVYYGPNFRYIEAYNKAVAAAREAVSEEGVRGRPTSYDAGHENFLLYSVLQFWTAGDKAAANKYYQLARELYGYKYASESHPNHQRYQFSQVTEQMVRSMMTDDVKTRAQTVSRINNALVRGFVDGLLEGDQTTYREYRDLAKQLHTDFQSGKVDTANTSENRSKLPEWDEMEAEAFKAVIGGFATIQPPRLDPWLAMQEGVGDRPPRILTIYERSRIWKRAPVTLKRQVYPDLRAGMERVCNEMGLDVNRGFPAPPGFTPADAQPESPLPGNE